jgi:hypothetical protein
MGGWCAGGLGGCDLNWLGRREEGGMGGQSVFYTSSSGSGLPLLLLLAHEACRRLFMGVRKIVSVAFERLFCYVVGYLSVCNLIVPGRWGLDDVGVVWTWVSTVAPAFQRGLLAVIDAVHW